MTNSVDQQSAEFDSAFAQAALPSASKPVDPNAPLPHYPSTRYIEKNLAPENTLSYGDVSALAAARKQAESTGVLTPELGAHLLPIAMVEGRGSATPYMGFQPSLVGKNMPATHGVNDNAFPDSPATRARFKKMGIPVSPEMIVPPGMRWDSSTYTGDSIQYFQHVPAPADITFGNGYIKVPIQTVPSGNIVPDMSQDDAGFRARMMAVTLAEKAAADKTKTLEGAVKGFNGSGPATEQYLKKVQDAKAMLLHTRNAPLMKHFNDTYLKK